MRIEKLDARQDGLPHGKLRVAAYVRVSVNKTAALESLENQSLTYTEQIKANPDWEFAGIYEDKGISGTKEMRPEFQRMLEDCRAGKIDLILTKSFTRFARNTVVLLETLRELKSLGIEVVFEKDNIRSLGESGELLITLLAAFAQAESYSASENIRWRVKKTFEEGHLASGGRMTGYRLVDGRLEIVPEEAEVVRMIFTDYLSGMGTLAIAKKLNHMGIRTIFGGYWKRNSVRNLLVNEKYSGDMLLQKTYTSDYITKKTLKNRGERTQYLVEGSHEAIITREMYAAVQEELERRAKPCFKKLPQPDYRKYPFTGFIICGKCGGRFQRKLIHINSKNEKPVWLCNTFNTIGKDFCDAKQIPEDILMEKTLELLGCGMEELKHVLPQRVKEIRVPEKGHLTYVFKDGSTQEVMWQDRSRRESWTDEMKQRMREQAIERHRKEAE